MIRPDWGSGAFFFVTRGVPDFSAAAHKQENHTENSDMKLASKLLFRLPLLAATSGILLLSTPPAVNAEPYNEDEWYDPNDWFDGNNVESDDTYDFGAWDYNDYKYGTGYDPYDYGLYDYGGYNDRDWNARTGDYGARNSYWRDTYDYDDDASNQRQAQQTQGRQGQQRTLAGTIEGFREVNVRSRQGERDRFTVVRVRLKDGRSAVVDLGKRLSLRDVNLQKGDYISVSGQQRTINGQNVIMANTIYANGQHHSITRGGAPATAQSQRESASQTFRGTVESFRRVNVEGAQSGHTLAKLTLENGKSMIVDFGQNRTPASLGINQGDYVSIRGNRTELDNKPILRAQSVYADGNWRDIPQTNRQNTNRGQQQ
jgi:hypothetical protein